MQKFLPIFCNFFYYDKKSIQYKLIEIFSIVFHRLFLMFPQFVLFYRMSRTSFITNIEIRFFEVPLSQQIKGLHEDLYDVGFAQSDDVGDGIIALPVWRDALMVAVPARHPLLTYKCIPLDELLRYPLVLADSQIYEGYAKHVERILRQTDIEPLIAERVASCDLMMVLVAAGFALGLAGESYIAASHESGVVSRPLALRVPPLTTWLLRPASNSSEVLARFIERVQQATESDTDLPVPSRRSKPSSINKS